MGLLGDANTADRYEEWVVLILLQLDETLRQDDALRFFAGALKDLILLQLDETLRRRGGRAE